MQNRKCTTEEKSCLLPVVNSLELFIQRGRTYPCFLPKDENILIRKTSILWKANKTNYFKNKPINMVLACFCCKISISCQHFFNTRISYNRKCSYVLFSVRWYKQLRSNMLMSLVIPFAHEFYKTKFRFCNCIFIFWLVINAVNLRQLINVWNSMCIVNYLFESWSLSDIALYLQV